MRLTAIIYLTSISLSQSLIGSDIALDRTKEEAVSQLIEKLEHHDFVKRNEATQQLWSLGARALPLLEVARSSSYPETSKRASMVSRLIKVNLKPTSPSEQLDQVRLFITADRKQQKQQALEQLLGLGAFEQAMAVIQTEENQEQRQYFERLKSIQRAIFREANKAVTDGDADKAIKTLRLAPYSKVNARALAHLLKSTGQLAKALKDFKHQPENPDATNLYLSMLRAEGNLKKIKAYSIQHNRSEALDSIAILEGDPMPVISYLGRRLYKDYQQSFFSYLIDTYEKKSLVDPVVFLESLAGEVDPDDLEQQDFSSLRRVMHYAMILGEREMGEELLVKIDKDMAIEYFSRSERVSEALKLIGAPDLVTEPALFTAWLTRQIELETAADSIFLENHESKVLQLAHFYINRGEKDVALERILKPLLTVVAVSDRARWREIVVNLIHAGASEQALQLVLDAGDEGAEYVSITTSLFENSEDVAKVWSTIEEVYLAEGRDHHFLHLMSLMGVSHADAAETQEIEKLIERSAKEATQQKALEVLLFAAETRGDLDRMLKVAKQLCSKEGEVNQNHLIKYWQAALAQANWAEILQAYEVDKNFFSRAPINLVYCAIAKRKLGREEEGKKLLEQVMVSSIGSSEYLNRIAYTLSSVGYDKEALSIWRSSMIQCDSHESGFLTALKYTNNHYKKTIEHREWPLVSAFSFVELASEIHTDYYDLNPLPSLHSGFDYLFTIGMSEVDKGNMKNGVEFLNVAHHSLLSDGSLADRFFPTLLRYPQLDSQRQHWFTQSWDSLSGVIEMYSKSHNTHNTIAWLGARNQMNLKGAEAHARLALKQEANSPAYLDTLAEIHFSKGDRKAAIEHSNEALQQLIAGAQPYAHSLELRTVLCWELRRQNRRFLENALPQATR